MKKVRITVLRKGFYPDLIRRICPSRRRSASVISFRRGIHFSIPAGRRCRRASAPWAWIDIYRSVSALSCGATYTPWQKQDGASVVCCTDGLRPVTFLLEAEEQSASAP